MGPDVATNAGHSVLGIWGLSGRFGLLHNEKETRLFPPRSKMQET